MATIESVTCALLEIFSDYCLVQPKRQVRTVNYDQRDGHQLIKTVYYLNQTACFVMDQKK